MRIKLHYGVQTSVRLIRFLEKYGISYEICRLPETMDTLCTFDLYKGEIAYHRFCVAFPLQLRNQLSHSVEYSLSEIEKAEWLYVRCKSKNVQWEYKDQSFSHSCLYRKLLGGKDYKHSAQIAPLVATTSMRWGKHGYFSGPNSADEYIFCSQLAKDMLDGKWTGLELWPVNNTNNEPYDDLYQLMFGIQLPIEAFCGGTRRQCHQCGKPYIKIDDALTQLCIKKQYLVNPTSVYTTGAILTDSHWGHSMYSMNIVSHSFYEFCERRHMNHGMIYEPVMLQ